MNNNPPWNKGLRSPVLSKKELYVAALVSQGMTDDEIAYRLKLSATSVKTYIKRARLKLGLRNRVQLAVWYVTRQLPAKEPLK